MMYPKLREIREAVISLFTPAYTTKFPYRPHSPEEGYRGKPVVDEENCVGCETCANVCPSHAITFKDDNVKGIRTITRDYGKCIFCGQCEEHCITGKGVSLSDKIYDIAMFDRSQVIEKQERDLIICEGCGEVITTKQHLQYLRKKLGARSYSSILNLNTINEDLLLADKQSVRVDVKDELKRKDMFSNLCPDCMRKVQIKNLFE